MDNGSRDRSAALAREAGARIVGEPRPGYGNAILAGIAAARGRFVILGDGDGQHDLGDLAPFWEKLQGGFDFVIGNRFAGGVEAGSMSFLRRYMGNPLLSGVGKLLFRIPVGDFHCGLRGFRRAGAESLALQCPGFEIASEMLIKAKRRNLRMAEVPVMQRPRADPDRPSHLRSVRDGWRHLRLMLMLAPRWMFLYPGGGLTAAGAMTMMTALLDSVVASDQYGAYTMLFGSAFIVCGAQLIGFHLLAHAYCEAIGIDDEWIRAGMRKHRILEYILAAGVALALAGAAGSFASLYVWSQTGPGQLETRLGVAIPSITALILGIQIMFFGFLIELLATQGMGKAESRTSRSPSGEAG